MKNFIILTLVSTMIFAATKTVVIDIKGMTCPLCTMAVKKSLKKVSGVIKVKVKLNTKKATVTYKEKRGIEKELLKAIKDTGYSGTFKK